jgi:hypothetical protein
VNRDRPALRPADEDRRERRDSERRGPERAVRVRRLDPLADVEAADRGRRRGRSDPDPGDEDPSAGTEEGQPGARTRPRRWVAGAAGRGTRSPCSRCRRSPRQSGTWSDSRSGSACRSPRGAGGQVVDTPAPCPGRPPHTTWSECPPARAIPRGTPPPAERRRPSRERPPTSPPRAERLRPSSESYVDASTKEATAASVSSAGASISRSARPSYGVAPLFTIASFAPAASASAGRPATG